MDSQESTEGWLGVKSPTEETYEDSTAPANKEASQDATPTTTGTEIGPSLSKQQAVHQNHQGGAQRHLDQTLSREPSGRSPVTPGSDSEQSQMRPVALHSPGVCKMESTRAGPPTVWSATRRNRAAFSGCRTVLKQTTEEPWLGLFFRGDISIISNSKPAYFL